MLHLSPSYLDPHHYINHQQLYLVIAHHYLTFTAESVHLLITKCGAEKIVTRKTGRFEYQKQHTIDIIHALLRSQSQWSPVKLAQTA